MSSTSLTPNRCPLISLGATRGIATDQVPRRHWAGRGAGDCHRDRQGLSGGRRLGQNLTSAHGNALGDRLAHGPLVRDPLPVAVG